LKNPSLLSTRESFYKVAIQKTSAVSLKGKGREKGGPRVTIV